jgi:AcrR family transcriptional regulator
VATSVDATERHILDTAYELFYRKGFGRVGVDELAAAAGFTKRTLYRHFRSKDDLLGAVLEFQHSLALAHIRKWQERYAGSAEDMIDLLFSELAKWSTKPEWTGAGFTRLAMELADLPGHPARTAAHRHKANLEEWYAELLLNAQVHSPEKRGRELALLTEGAMVLILIHGDPTYATAAANAAKALIRKA